MKRGEKILLAIGGAWTVGILLVSVIEVNEVGSDFLSTKELGQLTVVLLGIWTVLGLIWVFVYGRRE